MGRAGEVYTTGLGISRAERRGGDHQGVPFGT
jgi:hypothetical protein